MALFTRSGGRSKAASPADTPTAAPGPAAAASGFDPALEAAIRRDGAAFLESARSRRTGLLSTAFWSDKLMDWAMQDEAFKVQLFRFVDVFPRLRTPDQVHDHLADYLGQPGVVLPPGLGIGLKAGGVFKGAATKMITSRIESMAEKFIAGRDAHDAIALLEKLRRQGLAFSVDLLGEACVSRAEAEAYGARYLELVETLPGLVAGWADDPRLDRDHLGPIPRANVSIKISCLHAETDPIDHEGSLDALEAALEPILVAAAARNVLVNFDMEQQSLKDLTIELFERCCARWEFPAGIAMQAYLRSGDADADRIASWAERSGRRVVVRLVKGAYWDYETIHAEMNGWPVPVWSRKADSDACFERMARRLLESTPKEPGAGGTCLALGTHNARSIAAGLALLDRRGLPPAALELQMLHGMGDDLKRAAIDRGLRVREYLPVGEMIPGMAYLVRRLLENTSNESWLRAGFHDDASADALLASPHVTPTGPDPGIERIDAGPERHALSAAPAGVGDERPFMNEPPRDFARAAVRLAFAEAIARSEVPRVAIDATEADADRAIATAWAARESWEATPVRKRSAALLRAADLMRGRRDELCGILVREAGKTWREADGEVTEAIDFCAYYAREAVALFEPRRLGRFVGELDELFHQPRGVAVVISPWNFPLAILLGMTTAALVCGNPTIMKPAEQTPGIGRVAHEILREAGIPAEAVQFIPGRGETVGAQLVADPRTAIVAFTGSREVGLRIIAAAARTPEGQGHVKKVIAEMGGKNAIIVDDSADLDEAVLGVRASAFGFQGQKCSACSRAIILEGTHDEFVDRLVESTRGLAVGDPIDPATDIGPVIDEEAQAKILAAVATGREEATLALAGDLPDAGRLAPGRAYVAPHVFTGVAPDARIATEEIFGPVLAVIRARDFDDALAIANRGVYRLTGGIYSRKPGNLARARREFRVGNLYVNRGITGALVGRQPFGGFGLSGVGSKAGGGDYLLQFVEPRAICENTMRRGFAPEL